jgi:hypothetical protein
MPRLISEEFRRPGGKPPAAFLDTFPFANICSGSIATEMECPRYVRFPPNSDRRTDIAGCLKRARSVIAGPRGWASNGAAQTHTNVPSRISVGRLQIGLPCVH